ncbi:MAG TPA: hypothetical protein VFK05_21055 [Polyangiaceae bacterium]|nr:hypothetical protein [Polyangiaceae bacterium]
MSNRVTRLDIPRSPVNVPADSRAFFYIDWFGDGTAIDLERLLPELLAKTD